MSNEPPRTNAAEYTVSEISQAVKRTMEDTFGFVRVRGEVSKVARPGSGHVYFDLKDERAVLAAVAWKGTVGRWRFQPEQGLEVIVTGRMTTFPGQSKYQIVVDNVEPAGVGALMALIEERRKKLLAEGLFDPARKQELPYLPQVIGVITSPTGAVIRDILHRLDDRFPTHVMVWPVRVQGENCAPEVTAAIEGFNALPLDGPMPRPDLLIVARGGGSIEDLWGFNEESVVRAAAASNIPLISAVGHETDITLIDYAADKRAPTPTGAAEMAVPVRGELIAYVDDLGQRVRNAERRLIGGNRDRFRAVSAGLPRPAELLNQARQRQDLAAMRLTSGLVSLARAKRAGFDGIAPRLSRGALVRRLSADADRLGNAGERLAAGRGQHLRALRRELDSVGNRLLPVSLKHRIADRQDRLDRTAERLVPGFGRRLEKAASRLDAVGKLLDALSYKAVLERGFALVLDEDERLVRSASGVETGQPLAVRLADGDIQVRVENGDAPKRKPKKAPAKTSPKKPGPTGQESLF
ncbi:exodeoxyribonuclease VII large subunit [Cucumibacter marinus]|uniref:exodeoxyribonuclease VII large subunit n=1 Tax=Cucumibacter marinus TaxID=1121252 RepID=UPI00041F6631|nr:exodeoxyribonuclease VII large subunit [Cucumibacter marinus]